MHKIDSAAWPVQRREQTLKTLAAYQRLAKLPSEMLEQHLSENLERLLFQAKKAPYWSEVLNGLNLEKHSAMSGTRNLRGIPVLTRSQLQERPEELRISYEDIPSSHFQLHRTSGSTGKPVSVYKHSPTEQVNNWATELLDIAWQSRDLTLNTAFIKILPQNDESFSMGEPFTLISKTGKFFRRSLLSNTVSELLDFLLEKNVKNFLVNPMVMKHMVQEQKLRPRPGATFAQAMSWADRVTAELRSEMKEAFEAKVCDRYSSAEFGFLALQCPASDHLHALQFKNYIEILNDHGEQAAPGELGRVVVTSLENLAMPLIRYELGDLASWGDPCVHGINLPVLSPQIVRTREVNLLPDGSMEIPYFDWNKLPKKVSVRDSQMYRFQDGILVLYESADEMEYWIQAEARDQLARVFPSAQNIRLERVPDLSWLGLWKRKLVLTAEAPMPSSINLDYFKKLG